MIRLKNRRDRQRELTQNVGKPVGKPVGKRPNTQASSGSETFTGSGFSFVWPNINTALIEKYADNALLAEPLKNVTDLIFTAFSNHPTPWVAVRDPKGDIDDDLSAQGQTIAKHCDFYSAHIRAYVDQELGGCSVWSPGWGPLDGVDGICPIELRNLPWNSFCDAVGATDIYNDIMPGITVGADGETHIYQKPNARSLPVEIIQTSPFPSWLIVRNPISPRPSGRSGCLPVIALITNYNFADKALNMKMNRVAAPNLFLQVQNTLTPKMEEYAKTVIKKWGTNTGFLLTKDLLPVDSYLTETKTAEDRLAWLQKRINDFYNPASFLQNVGPSLGGSDLGGARLISNMITSTLSRLEHDLGEKLLNIWLSEAGYVGYTSECRYPRPETEKDQQVLAEISEASRSGQITRAEARSAYPNLDLPEQTPEEEAKLAAEISARPTLTNPNGSFWNLSSPPPQPSVEKALMAATARCKAEILKAVRTQVASTHIRGERR